MSESIWKPNTTVAVIVERDGRYLLVEEHTADGLRFNQPAGHLDHGESLLAASVREAREETGYTVIPTALVGIYQWSPPGKPGLTYLRVAYAAELDERAPVATELDPDILRPVWLGYDELLACRERHRSPLVLQCIDDYRAGRRYPLELISHHD
ncbi:NUDIX hydrolase [Chitinimonas sp. BJYL2]|uniref:NUDIX hydrolase n=1 Tax=Chitinimonas sp. BJYL2 TaxID=2976696 RepID=UPI0022B38A72|nr:NUDIX hydrolase [Chitinimonas sp. BJYL2]